MACGNAVQLDCSVPPNHDKMTGNIAKATKTHHHHMGGSIQSTCTVRWNTTAPQAL